MKREDIAAKMLSAAKELVHTHGYEAITVREVAKRSGCTYPLLYHYYHDLEGFLWKLRIDMMEDMIRELEVPRGAPAEPLRAALLRYTAYFLDHPNVYRFFYFRSFKRPEASDDYAAVESRIVRMRTQYFADFYASRGHPPLSAERVAKTVVFAIHGILTLTFSANGEMDREAAFREENELLDHLLGKS